MHSWLMLDVILVDAVIYDIPLICAWLLNHGVMGCAINLVLWILNQNDRILGYLDRTERRLRCSISHMIVGCTRIIHRPHEVVESVAIEHVWRLAISIILQTSTLWSHHGYGFILNLGHAWFQLGTSHKTVAPIEVRFLGNRVDEDIHIDELTVATRMVLRQKRMAQVNERTCRRIRNRYTHLLSAVIIRIGTEIEIVLVAAVLLLYLYGCRSPEIAVGPGNLVALCIKHHAFILPFLEIFRRIAIILPSTPSRSSIRGGIDIILLCLAGIQDFRVCMKIRKNRISLTRV